MVKTRPYSLHSHGLRRPGWHTPRYTLFQRRVAVTLPSSPITENQQDYSGIIWRHRFIYLISRWQKGTVTELGLENIVSDSSSPSQDHAGAATLSFLFFLSILSIFCFRLTAVQDGIRSAATSSQTTLVSCWFSTLLWLLSSICSCSYLNQHPSDQLISLPNKENKGHNIGDSWWHSLEGTSGQSFRLVRNKYRRYSGFNANRG